MLTHLHALRHLRHADLLHQADEARLAVGHGAGERGGGGTPAGAFPEVPGFPEVTGRTAAPGTAG